MSSISVAKPNNRLLQLDGIKGIICFFIIFIHYRNRMGCEVFPATFIPSLLVDKGWMFVELFFIISGFLMAYSMKKRMQTTSLKSFMFSRFDRLLPPILFATLLEITVKVISMLVLNSGSRLSVTEIINSLTFASTYIYNGDPLPSVLWYIHVLILCYFVYYIICRFRRSTVYYVGILALFFFGWVLISQAWDVPFLFSRIGRGYFAFALG